MRGVSVRMMEEGGNYVHDWGLFSFYVMPSNSVCRRLGGLGLSIVCVSYPHHISPTVLHTGWQGGNYMTTHDYESTSAIRPMV